MSGGKFTLPQICLSISLSFSLSLSPSLSLFFTNLPRFHIPGTKRGAIQKLVSADDILSKCGKEEKEREREREREKERKRKRKRERGGEREREGEGGKAELFSP
jgi:hypothetical protein